MSEKSAHEKCTTGHCLCKATSWAFDGEPSWACYCHCDDCRRNCGAPVVGWLGVPLKQFSWTGKAPKTFQSSIGVWRHFCGDCGSPMGFEAAHYEGGMHLYAGSLADPGDFNPTFHVNYKDKLDWLPIEDDLVKYDTTLRYASDDLSTYE